MSIYRDRNEAMDALERRVAADLEAGRPQHQGVFYSVPSFAYFLLPGARAIIAPTEGTDLVAAWVEDRAHDGKATGYYYDAQSAQAACRAAEGV